MREYFLLDPGGKAGPKRLQRGGPEEGEALGSVEAGLMSCRRVGIHQMAGAAFCASPASGAGSLVGTQLCQKRTSAENVVINNAYNG